MHNEKKFWMESMKGRDRSEDLGIDGRILLEWILGNRWGSCRLGWWRSG